MHGARSRGTLGTTAGVAAGTSSRVLIRGDRVPERARGAVGALRGAPEERDEDCDSDTAAGEPPAGRRRLEGGVRGRSAPPAPPDPDSAFARHVPGPAFLPPPRARASRRTLRMDDAEGLGPLPPPPRGAAGGPAPAREDNSSMCPPLRRTLPFADGDDACAPLEGGAPGGPPPLTMSKSPPLDRTAATPDYTFGSPQMRLGGHSRSPSSGSSGGGSIRRDRSPAPIATLFGDEGSAGAGAGAGAVEAPHTRLDFGATESDRGVGGAGAFSFGGGGDGRAGSATPPADADVASSWGSSDRRGPTLSSVQEDSSVVEHSDMPPLLRAMSPEIGVRSRRTRRRAPGPVATSADPYTRQSSVDSRGSHSSFGSDFSVDSAGTAVPEPDAAKVELVLPTVESSDFPDLNVISPETLQDVVGGKFDDVMPNGFRVLDCRYSYEYAGGHVMGATNMFDPRAMEQQLLYAEGVSGRTSPILIFHCEFSKNRAPKLMRHLRNVDRKIHQETYPELYYPQLYLVDKGYKNVFNTVPDVCEPRAYRSMHEPEFHEQCSWHVAFVRQQYKRGKRRRSGRLSRSCPG